MRLLPCADPAYPDSFAARVFGVCAPAPEASPYVTGEFPLDPLSLGLPEGVESCEEWVTRYFNGEVLPAPAEDHECFPALQAQAATREYPQLPGPKLSPMGEGLLALKSVAVYAGLGFGALLLLSVVSRR